MPRLVWVVLLVLTFAVSGAAQALSPSKQPATRWFLEFATGTSSGLGYKLPHLAVGAGFERPVGRRVEFQGEFSYSPDKKYITNDGNSIRMNGRAIVWANARLGITAEAEQAYLWTSQFNKSGVGPAIGVVIREHFEDLPGRFYLSYLLPTGCQWGPNCKIQSNRDQGPQWYWEHRMWPHFILGLRGGFRRILNQSNPLEPSIARTREWSGFVHVIMRFPFPPTDVEQAY
jgi:hypothetical protein